MQFLEPRCLRDHLRRVPKLDGRKLDHKTLEEIRVRAIHAVWRQMIVTAADTTTVHIVSAHEDANVEIRPRAAGGLTFAARRDHTLRLRIPARVAAAAIQVQGLAAGAMNWSADQRWLMLTLQRADRGSISWPMPLWSTREVAGPTNHLSILPGTRREDRLSCVLEYRGNELIRITPPGLKLPYIQGL